MIAYFDTLFSFTVFFVLFCNVYWPAAMIGNKVEQATSKRQATSKAKMQATRRSKQVVVLSKQR